MLIGYQWLQRVLCSFITSVFHVCTGHEGLDTKARVSIFLNTEIYPGDTSDEA